MGKYRITFFVPGYAKYFLTDTYEVDGTVITFSTVPQGIRTTIVGSFMIEELICRSERQTC